MMGHTDYSIKLAHVAQELAAQGKTNAEIAKALGISSATLYNWRNDHPEFKSCLSSGKDSYDTDVVEKALLEDAMGKDYEEVVLERDKEGFMVETKRTKKWQRNFQAQRMWLVNRNPARWKDQQELVIKDGELEAKLVAAEKRLQELRNGKTSETGDRGRDQVAEQVGPEDRDATVPGTVDSE